MEPTPTLWWGSSSRASTYELIKQNKKSTAELHHIKEEYADTKGKWDKVLVFQQEFTVW